MKKNFINPLNLLCISVTLIIILLDISHIFNNVFLDILSYVLIFYVAYSLPKNK